MYGGVLVECWWTAAALTVTRSPRLPTNLMVESRGSAEARSQASSPLVPLSAGGVLWECWLWVPPSTQIAASDAGVLGEASWKM